MRSSLIHHYYSSSQGVSYTLGNFSIQYNNTDATYITEKAGYADISAGGSLASAANTLRVLTILPDQVTGNDEANTGLDRNPATDEFICVSNFERKAYIFSRADILTAAAASGGTIPTALRSITIAGSQGISIDPVNNQLIDSAFGGTNKIYDYTSGAEVSSFTGVSGATMAYDYRSQILYLSNSPSAVIKRRQLIGGTWTDIGDMSIYSEEGIAINFVLNKLTNCTSRNITKSFLSQDTDGFGVTPNGRFPTTGMQSFAEGCFVDVDGTIWFNADEFFHGGVVGGNRLIQVDPHKYYLKYIRIPQMIRYDYFKLSGLSISGDYDGQGLIGSGTAISPVLDFDAFTYHQGALSRWAAENNFTIEFRSSTSAPSTSPLTPIACSVNYYDANGSNDGWGSTTPSGWGSSIPTDRYIQFRLTLAETTEETTIADTLGSDLLDWFEMHKVNNMFVDSFSEPTSGEFTTGILLNKMDYTKSLVQATITNRPRWVPASAYLDIGAANANKWVTFENVADVISLDNCELHMVVRRLDTNRNGIYFAAVQSSTNNNQFVIRTIPGNAGANQNFHGVDFIDNSGAQKLIGFTDAGGQTFRLLSWRFEGGVVSLYINNVTQALTAVAGTNAGITFSALTGLNTVSMGRRLSSTALQGFGWHRMFMRTALLDSTKRGAILSYAQDESMI
jgi:hypothetical protein